MAIPDSQFSTFNPGTHHRERTEEGGRRACGRRHRAASDGTAALPNPTRRVYVVAGPSAHAPTAKNMIRSYHVFGRWGAAQGPAASAARRRRQPFRRLPPPRCARHPAKPPWSTQRSGEAANHSLPPYCPLAESRPAQCPSAFRQAAVSPFGRSQNRVRKARLQQSRWLSRRGRGHSCPRSNGAAGIQECQLSLAPGASRTPAGELNHQLCRRRGQGRTGAGTRDMRPEITCPLQRSFQRPKAGPVVERPAGLCFLATSAEYL